MRIIILGGGVIGVTSAWYLARAGHEVTVIDRQAGPALETSFANAGEISPGYASPWASPSVPKKAIGWLFQKHAPLILRPKADPYMAKWIISMLANCTAERYALNKGRMVRLAEYSRDMLRALRAETGITYDERSQGTLQVFRTQKQLDGIGGDVEILKKDGVPFEVLDAAGCVAAEPALAYVKEKIVGGLRLPNDETGDCFKFTTALAKMAADAGVTFHFETEITAIHAAGGLITGIDTSAGRFDADRYVAALGSYTPKALRHLGIAVPVYPVKGYSLTLPIVDEARAPVSTVMDETYKIAITRLGDRIRIGGMAEVSGFTDDLPPARRATLEHSVTDLFPGGDKTRGTFWSGLRPMTPDGTPVIGATRYGNLLLNTGHGTLGWTMACGSGRVLADLISGVKPEIETADLALSRYA